MPTSAEQPDLLVDTSAAIALVVADHAHHENVFRALSRRRLGLSGHAAFETFSVLTRLPPPARRSATAAARSIATNFPGSRFLSEDATARLLASFARLGIAGGSVYDALVGAAAKENGLVLGSRDRRAIDVYRALDVDVELLS